MHLLDEQFIFWSEDWGFLKEGVMTYQSVTNVAS